MRELLLHLGQAGYATTRSSTADGGSAQRRASDFAAAVETAKEEARIRADALNR